MDRVSEEKQARLTEVLSRGVAMIHLDARRAGVIVPPATRNDHHLRLNLSYGFDPPDLSVGEWGVRETLSFARAPFACAVPWSAIFAISDPEKVWVFPSDLPRELLGDFAAAAEAAAAEEQKRLTVVPSESPAAPGPAPARAVPARNPPKLRLIKND